MIVRILGEGQYVLDDTHSDVLNALDTGLEEAVESDDDTRFRAALSDLLAKVRALGTPLAADSLQESDAILPDEEAHVDEVRAMLADSAKGLIPG
jgi:hypothetical protein